MTQAKPILTPAQAAASQREAGPDLYRALYVLLGVIKAAGLHNLTRGVPLGQTVWYVKASDAVELAERALAKADAP